MLVFSNGPQSLAFPTGRDSATFWDKGTEVPSLSRDKGTMGQGQNLTKGRDGPRQPVKMRDGTLPRQPVKIRDGTLDGTVRDFDSLSRPAGQNGTEQKSTF